MRSSSLGSRYLYPRSPNTLNTSPPGIGEACLVHTCVRASSFGLQLPLVAAARVPLHRGRWLASLSNRLPLDDRRDLNVARPTNKEPRSSTTKRRDEVRPTKRRRRGASSRARGKEEGKRWRGSGSSRMKKVADEITEDITSSRGLYDRVSDLRENPISSTKSAKSAPIRGV